MSLSHAAQSVVQHSCQHDSTLTLAHCAAHTVLLMLADVERSRWYFTSLSDICYSYHRTTSVSTHERLSVCLENTPASLLVILLFWAHEYEWRNEWYLQWTRMYWSWVTRRLTECLMASSDTACWGTPWSGQSVNCTCVNTRLSASPTYIHTATHCTLPVMALCLVFIVPTLTLTLTHLHTHIYTVHSLSTLQQK